MKQLVLCIKGRLLKVAWTARRSNKYNLKGNQSWIVTGQTDAETPVFWSSDSNRWLTGKVPDAGKDREQKEKRVSEDEMGGQSHWCNEHELGQTGRRWRTGKPDVLHPWGCKEPNRNEWLNNKKLKHITNAFKCHTFGDLLSKNTFKWAG